MDKVAALYVECEGVCECQLLIFGVLQNKRPHLPRFKCEKPYLFTGKGCNLTVSYAPFILTAFYNLLRETKTSSLWHA